MSTPGYVYRTFDNDGRLLYVGCTTDLRRRMCFHQRQPWWNAHAYVTVERFDTRDEAAEAEVQAIRTEFPRWNIEHRSPDHPDGPITQSLGRWSAPWLRDELLQWRAERMEALRNKPRRRTRRRAA